MSAKPTNPSTPLAEITHGPSKFELFLENNQKLLLLLAVLVALGTAGYVVMRGVEKGKQEAAGASMIHAMNAEDLKEVTEEHAGTQAAKSSYLLLADNQWILGEKEASITTLKHFLDNHTDHPAAPSAKASLASKLMLRGESDEAARLFQELVDEPEARYLGSYALINLGDIAAAAGDNDKAKRHYERVISDFSESNFTRFANSRLNDLGTEAPTVVAPPEPLEPEIPASLRPLPEGSSLSPETSNEADATLDEEISLDPTELPAPANQPIPNEEASPEAENDSPETESEPSQTESTPSE